MAYDLWLQCASEPPTEMNRRSFSWGIHREGYGPIVDRLLKVAKPGQRVMLHNPFGKSPATGSKMEWDQQLNCENAGLSHVVKSFQQEVPRLLAAVAEVIVYLGAPHNTPRMIDLASKSEGVDNWIWNAWRACRMPVDLGCTIGLDNFGGLAVTEYEAKFAEFLDAMFRPHGRRLYIEATTEFTSTLHDRFPMFVLETTFASRHQSPQHPGAAGRFPTVGEPRWYTQPIVTLFQTGNFAVNQAGNFALIDRVNQLVSDYGVSPMLTLPLAERMEAMA